MREQFGEKVTILGSNQTDGQSSANLPLVAFNGTSYDRLRTASSTGTGKGVLMQAPFLFNGVNYDNQYNNTQGALLASAARTANTISPTQINYNASGVIIFVTVTVASGTGGLQPRIRGYAPNGSIVWHNDPPAYITGIGTYAFELYPGNSVAAGDIKQRTAGTLPRTWSVEVRHGDATSYTYEVGYALIN